MQKPSIARIVHFRLSAEQADAINRRRTSSGSIADRLEAEKWPRGAQAHVGNSVHEGQVLPLVVTQVWPTEYEGNAYLSHHSAIALGGAVPVYESAFGVNGQVLLDGTDSFWVTSAPQHSTLTGCWFWPPRD